MIASSSDSIAEISCVLHACLLLRPRQKLRRLKRKHRHRHKHRHKFNLRRLPLSLLQKTKTKTKTMKKGQEVIYNGDHGEKTLSVGRRSAGQRQLSVCPSPV